MIMLSAARESCEQEFSQSFTTASRRPVPRRFPLLHASKAKPAAVCLRIGGNSNGRANVLVAVRVVGKEIKGG